MAASQSQKSWASDLLDLCLAINKTVEEKKVYINEQQCFVVKLLAEYIQHYVNQWRKICGEEIWWDVSKEVGKELHTVLDRGLQLVSLCVQKSCHEAEIAFLSLGCKGELGEIIDDASIYAQMINRSILHNTLNSSLLKQRSDVEELMFEVDLNCNNLHFYLGIAYEQDKNTLINSLGTKFSWIPLPVTNVPVSSLLLTLKTTKEPNINDSDLSIKEDLGSGSFGIVQSAEWHKIRVAVKKFMLDEHLKDELVVFDKLLHSDSPPLYNKVHSDSLLYKKLQHADSPHLVRMLGYSASNKLVLELMDKDLRKQISEGLEYPLIQSLDLMLQIAKAMRHLHNMDVVHRDLKPANVLLKCRTDGSLLVKLTDFGLSKDSFETAMTHTDMRGTLMYMAPEMKLGKGKYSRKVDVYSFGLICVEILAGKMRTDSGQALALPEDTPKKLESLIRSCTELDDGKRPSFEDICESLWLVKEEMLTKVPYTETMEMKLTRGLQGMRIENIPSASTFTPKRVIHAIKHTDIHRLSDFPAEGLFDLLLDMPEKALTPIPSGEIRNDSPQDLHIFVQQFQKLVDQGRKFNLCLRIGGYYTENFSAIFATAETRETLVNSILKLLRTYPIFNGLLIDWFWCIRSYVKKKHVVFVLEALKLKLRGSVTIALTSKFFADNHWQIIGKAIHLVDQFHVELPFTGGKAAHISALYPSSLKERNIDEALKLYRGRVPSSKLFIKAELVSYEYADTDGIGTPAANENWGLFYNNLPPAGSAEKWDDISKAAYAYDPNQRKFWSYDNNKSMIEKAKYIKENDLGGIVVYWVRADFSYDHERSAIKALHDHLMHG